MKHTIACPKCAMLIEAPSASCMHCGYNPYSEAAPTSEETVRLQRVGRPRTCEACGGTGRITVNVNHLPKGFALWATKAGASRNGRTELVCPACEGPTDQAPRPL